MTFERKGGNWAPPSTVNEQAADSEAQAAYRALIARRGLIEHEIEVQTHLLHSYALARDRKRQLEISQKLDELEAELHLLRPKLGATGERHRAGSELVKTDRQRGADALDTIMHQPSIKKSELPDVFELDNSMGLRSQPKIK